MASIGLIVNAELCEQLELQYRGLDFSNFPGIFPGDFNDFYFYSYEEYNCNDVSVLMCCALLGCAVPVLVGAVSLALAATGRKKQPIGSTQVAHET